MQFIPKFLRWWVVEAPSGLPEASLSNVTSTTPGVPHAAAWLGYEPLMAPESVTPMRTAAAAVEYGAECLAGSAKLGGRML